MNHTCLWIAFALFLSVALLRLKVKAYDTACVALGFGFVVLSILITTEVIVK